jgi:hypothetical protein
LVALEAVIRAAVVPAAAGNDEVCGRYVFFLKIKKGVFLLKRNTPFHACVPYGYSFLLEISLHASGNMINIIKIKERRFDLV